MADRHKLGFKDDLSEKSYLVLVGAQYNVRRYRNDDNAEYGVIGIDNIMDMAGS